MFYSELKLRLVLGFLFLTASSLCLTAESKCSKGCNLALGSYYLWTGANFTFISQLVNTDIPNILSYNPQIPNQDSLIAGTRIVIPFSCDCLHNGDFLGHVFSYVVKSSDTYSRISGLYYSNLTTIEQLQRFNSYDPNNIPDTGVTINVTVNCSCGDSSVSKDYGLFITYPLLPVDTLDSIALASNLSRNVLQAYNPNANFSAGTGVVYIPGKDQTGTYPPLKSASKSGLSGGAIVGVAVGVAAVVIILLAVVFYILKQRKKRVGDKLLLSSFDEIPLQPTTPGSGTHKESNSAVSPGLMGLTVEKSVEFTYEELASATDDFSLANKIGQGGFGAVYYAELRSEKAAIKKMDMQATKEFLAELKVLTRVHHLNLVRLIGYCVQGSLFLVYEYIENGNLSQHLRRSGSRDPLSWSTRVQIALDSARGLEYIHEHTVPVYIHRDIKSANILIDKNFHAKVADFGLAKLTDVGSSTTATKVVGTFGYMPPEYAQYGDASPKVDVYAFGVVLYELISAKEAVIRTDNSSSESKGLVALFDEVLSQPEPKPDLPKLIDPRLGDDYPLDSVCKMAQLAKACTQENPQLRPSMRSIVVALMTLSSSTEDWDIGSFYDNQAFVNLMSGR